MPMVRVASLAELPTGKGKQIDIAGRKIALFHSDGQVYAIDDACPHRGAPLSEGQCRGNQVMCPWHATRFDLSTGAVLCPPAKSGVTAYRVEVVGDEVLIEV